MVIIQWPVANCVSIEYVIVFLIGDLIESVLELRSLSVDESADKDKQKTQARHIVHRRRKSLSDLFHLLEQLGQTVFCN